MVITLRYEYFYLFIILKKKKKLGINEYLSENKKNLPVEFTILGIDPEPWNIHDVLAMGRLSLFFIFYFENN